MEQRFKTKVCEHNRVVVPDPPGPMGSGYLSHRDDHSTCFGDYSKNYEAELVLEGMKGEPQKTS